MMNVIQIVYDQFLAFIGAEQSRHSYHGPAAAPLADRERGKNMLKIME
jgi:hypothetical protein